MPLQHSKGGYQGCGSVPKAAGTQCTLLAAFSDVSGRFETSLSAPRIDNSGNDEDGDRETGSSLSYRDN